MPVCYAGNIKSLEQASQLYSIGVEKIGLGDILIYDFNIISKISKTFGSQSVVSILNLVERNNKIYLYDYKNKIIKNDLDIFEFLNKIQDFGTGEIILHFVENDGNMKGYNYNLIDKLIDYIKVPLVF